MIQSTIFFNVVSLGNEDHGLLECNAVESFKSSIDLLEEHSVCIPEDIDDYSHLWEPQISHNWTSLMSIVLYCPLVLMYVLEYSKYSFSFRWMYLIHMFVAVVFKHYISFATCAFAVLFVFVVKGCKASIVLVLGLLFYNSDPEFW
jgi:hypothetical protein